VANGSDFPVEKPDPMPGFYASVTRQDAEGQPNGGWMADQVMTREQALESWTLAGAYAAFEEKDKGSLEVGKLADFIILSKDIMKVAPAEILSTKVTTTVLGGRIVYTQ
jgi:predicted amidohydrolase YtcJ